MSYTQRNPIRLSPHFSAATFQVRKEGQNIYKVRKERNRQSTIINPVTSPLRIEESEFPPKHKLNKFIIFKPNLQKMLKGLL